MSGEGAAPGDARPEIDVRSPAERWAEAGHARYERLQQFGREAPVDAAALTWMIFVIGLTALGIYGALRASGFDPGLGIDWWTRAALLSSTGGVIVIFGSMIGLALAALSDTVAARVSLVLATIGGAWAAVAGLFGVAVAFHEPASGFQISFVRGAENKIVAALGEVMLGGLGIVVALLALRLLAIRRSGTAGAAPQTAELS